MNPTPLQLAALGAALDAGSVKEAAYGLGVSYSHMRRILSRLYRAIDVANMAQAVEVCDERFPGWHVRAA